MRRGLKRLTAVALTTGSMAMATAAAWYWWTPAMTIEAMADAAARRDGAGVAVHMDMTALRANTRLIAENELRRTVPSGRIALNHRAITEIMVGHVIDGVFSTKGTGQLVEGQADPLANRGALAYRIMLVGPNQFVARLDAPRRVDLLFIRHGAEWLLSAVRMRPPEAPRNYV